MKKICCIAAVCLATVLLSSCSRILINGIESVINEYNNNYYEYYEHYDDSYYDFNDSSYDNSYDNSYDGSDDDFCSDEDSTNSDSSESPSSVSLLDDMEYIKKTSYLTINTANGYKNFYCDVEENSYSGNVIYPSGGTLATQKASSEEDSYISYYLNKKYNTLTGTIYRPYGTLSCTTVWESSTTIKIYGDDVLLYEAPDITQATYSPIDFEIDVSGVRELKIVMLGVWTEDGDWPGQYERLPKACMTNLIVSK